MKAITRSWLWIGIVLLFGAGCVYSFVHLHPVLGVTTALLGWLLLMQNPDGRLHLPKDKLYHLLAGAAVAALVQPHAGVIAAGLTCCTIAALKELWDGHHKGVTSFADFLWTCAGGLLAIHVWLILSL